MMAGLPVLPRPSPRGRRLRLLGSVNLASASATSTQTFSWGDAVTDTARRLFCCVGTRRNQSDGQLAFLQSARFTNGSSFIDATVHITQQSGSASNNSSNNVGICSAIVPKNNFNQIELTFNHPPNAGLIAALISTNFLKSSTPTETDGVSVFSNGNTSTDDLTIPSQGIVIGAAVGRATGFTVTWDRGTEVFAASAGPA